MRDLTHRILLVAGTTLLGLAVIYGAPSTAVWPESGQGLAPMGMASAADIPAPFRTAVKEKSPRRTDTVKPNGASCPGANTAPVIPPANEQSGEGAAQNPPATPPMPNGKVASPCPPTASDVGTDIARGHALATPEPLNPKQLVAPRAKPPG